MVMMCGATEGLQLWSLLVSVLDCLSTKSGESLENGLNMKRTLYSSPLLPLFDECPFEEGAPSSKSL